MVVFAVRFLSTIAKQINAKEIPPEYPVGFAFVLISIGTDFAILHSCLHVLLFPMRICEK